MRDLELILALGALHLVAIAAGVGLIFFALHEREEGPPDAGHGDDGGNPARLDPGRPRGGPPLPSADPARVRLRGPERLADRHRARPRRGPVEPRRPRVPARPRRSERGSGATRSYS